MGRLRVCLVSCLVLVCFASGPANGAVPSTITTQGKLTDAAGVPLPAGPKPFTFRIFNASLGGTKIWPASAGEMQSVTTSTEGLWTALVGAIEPLAASVFADSVRWLEIEVDGTVLPRVRLVTGPFAYRVATVDGASGGTITSKVSIGTGHLNLGTDCFVAGSENEATNDYAAVGGGALNRATGASAVVPGGQQNTASGFASAVGGGASNTASETYSAVGGGLFNSSSGTWAVVNGGILNSANHQGAAVGGGGNNHARGPYSTVAGGGGNDAADSNSATGDRAAIGGGTSNVASGERSTIGGGGHNTASGISAAVAGGGGVNPGDGNTASGDLSFIGGGQEHLASGWSSTVGGGFVNIATSEGATIGGGVANGVSGASAVVAGGNSCVASGAFATVAGGLHNMATDSGAAIGGGGYNKAYGFCSVIAGGGGMLAEDSNSTDGWWGVIGGGRRNRATDFHGTVAGGIGNTAGQFSCVGGGSTNLAYGSSSVGGGYSNTAGGNYSAVGGGRENSAVAYGATVPGGYDCHASGDYSLAAGHQARVHHSGSFVWSDETFYFPGLDSAASTAPNQFIIRATGGVGIGTTTPSQALHVMGNIIASGCVIASNTVCPSDSLFKRNITTYHGALQDVGRLRGVRYEWKRDAYPDRGFGEGGQIGLIAQEVRQVLPQAVVEQRDGYLAVDYARLVPVLIEAIKEQQAEIEELRTLVKRQGS